MMKYLGLNKKVSKNYNEWNAIKMLMLGFSWI